MKFSIAMIAGVFLVASASYAGVTINGTTITFDDATMQTTAFTGGGGGAPADHGGTSNTVNGTDSFVGGGYSNLVTDDYGTIGGGQGNQAGDNAGTASDKNWATVSGGYSNTASGSYSTVGGGYKNTASGNQSFIGGGGGIGATNTASGYASVIGGGRMSTASGNQSVVGGGSGNTASANFATVPGGSNNTASGQNSFAAGLSANASHQNSFVWGGQNGARTSFGPDTFNVWSAEIYLDGAVAHGSDRDMKEAFSFVSAREVLDKVVEMPVSTWRFKTEDDSVRHIGPMAQDFMAAFGYGRSDKHIVGTDADGVALAAIQGLNEKLEEQTVHIEAQAEINTALRWHNAQLHSRNDALEARLSRLEKAILRESVSEPTGTD